MAHLLQQLMSDYCKDYELLFCNTEKITALAMNTFIEKYNMYFNYNGYGSICSLLFDGEYVERDQ